MYGIFGRDITKCMVIYGACIIYTVLANVVIYTVLYAVHIRGHIQCIYVRFWPTLNVMLLSQSGIRESCKWVLSTVSEFCIFSSRMRTSITPLVPAYTFLGLTHTGTHTRTQARTHTGTCAHTDRHTHAPLDSRCFSGHRGALPGAVAPKAAHQHHP